MLFEYETDRLILRILRPENAASVLDFYLRDRELFEKYETERLPNFYTINHHQKLLRFEYNAALKLSTVRFYVFLKSNPSQIIGTVCLHGITRSFYQTCEIGYKFSSEFHEHGYALEAVDYCTQIVFKELELHRITAYVCEGNERSMHLLETLGFHKDGVCRDYLFLQNCWQDHMMYSLLITDVPHHYEPQ